MSGILALVTRGAPPDDAMVSRMSAALRSFGHDGGRRWSDGTATLAVEWHRTRPREAQPPLALGAGLALVADARVDDRERLATALRDAGFPAAPGAPDAELLLAAYRAWGERCVDRLLGDFAFAVWDAAHRRLFCARDHMGVRPLYYAALPGEGILVASGMEAVRLHPQVAGTLDDQAVADFLVSGWPLDEDGTVLAGVRMLPRGHTLTATPGGIALRRYWAPEPVDELHYRTPREYSEHFNAVFGDAVRDRAAGATTAVLMSGGRDSVSVAATLRRAVPAERVVAVTTGYASLMPDPDQDYARLAARALEVQHRVIYTDHHGVFGPWADPAFRTEEPSPLPTIGYERQLYEVVSAEAPVVLMGQGADAVLRESGSRLARLLLEGRMWRAGREAVAYLRIHRRLPRPGVRTLWRRRRGWRRLLPPVPAWVRPEVARRLDLAERLATLHRPRGVDHQPHSGALDSLRSAPWPRILALHHPPTTGAPTEVAHPFFDQRVIRFLLSVPEAQWYNDKGLLRMLLEGAVPPAFLRRQKSWMHGEPLAARIAADGGAGWVPPVRLSPRIERWVDAGLVPRWAGGRAPVPLQDAWIHLTPLSLSVWLDRTDAQLPE